MTFISTHIISKEYTNLGIRFLNGCLRSLYDSGYPNEIILVDNGSSKEVFDVYDHWKEKFIDIDCPLIVHKSDSKDFTSLRNLCLEKTNPQANFIHWQDSDEIYYPSTLDVLKEFILPECKSASKIWSQFLHFMIHPWMVQDLCSKDNIFPYSKNLVWKSSVHEHMYGLSDGPEIEGPARYVHLGYIRSQFRTTIKWLLYDYIAHGHINGYKLENIQKEDGSIEQKHYFRDWRNPNNTLWDRRPLCSPYPLSSNELNVHHLIDGKWTDVNYPEVPKDFPDAMEEVIGDITTNLTFPPNKNNLKKYEKLWVAKLNEIDPTDFWDQWQEKYKEMGNWKDTLDWVLEECIKLDWRI